MGTFFVEDVDFEYVIAKEEQLPMHFVTNANSKFAVKKGLSIQDIAQEPFILTEYGQGYRRVFDRELAKNPLILHLYWK